MDTPIDLPRVRQALAALDRLAAEHPQRLHQGEPWSAHLEELEAILVEEPPADRRYPSGNPEVSGGVGGGVKPTPRMDGGMEGKTLSQKNARASNVLRQGEAGKPSQSETG